MSLYQIQAELKAPKNQFNKYGGYEYRSVEDILVALKPLLLKYKCAITFKDEIVLVGDRYYIKATATLQGEEIQASSEAMAREPLTQKGMSEPQLTGRMKREKLQSKVYRAKQIAEITGVSLATVWKYSKDGLLTPIHVTPRVTVFNADEVHKLFGITK